LDGLFTLPYLEVRNAELPYTLLLRW